MNLLNLKRRPRLVGLIIVITMLEMFACFFGWIVVMCGGSFLAGYIFPHALLVLTGCVLALGFDLFLVFDRSRPW